MSNGQEAYRTLNYCGKFNAEGVYPILGVNSVAPWQWYCDSRVRSPGDHESKYTQNGRGLEGQIFPLGTVYCLAVCVYNDPSAEALDVTLRR